jgi:hypothetical protein
MSKDICSDKRIIELFPHLTPTSFSITSPKDVLYYCIAWAAEDHGAWWWPDTLFLGYWPLHIPREETLDSFKKLFESFGYSICDGPGLEDGFEKIAIYTDLQGKPTHAAKQLDDGKWTSKLGELEDIEHDTLEGISGSSYGTASIIMRRPSRGR